MTGASATTRKSYRSGITCTRAYSDDDPAERFEDGISRAFKSLEKKLT